MEISNFTANCGLKLITGVSSATIKYIQELVHKGTCSTRVADWSAGAGYKEAKVVLTNGNYVFTDNEVGKGKLLAAEILKYNVGELEESKWFNNPVHGTEGAPHNIKIWIWHYIKPKTLELRKQEELKQDTSEKFTTAQRLADIGKKLIPRRRLTAQTSARELSIFKSGAANAIRRRKAS